jgi:hypothetical protein
MSEEKEGMAADKKEEMAADKFLGRLLKDKVTGFTGIAVVKGIHLFGCNTYALAPAAKEGKLEDAHSFDEGRLEIIGPGITADEVKSSKPGGVDIDLTKKVD